MLVEWEETINHTGYYRIAFSPDGLTGFDANILADNITDDQNEAIQNQEFHKFSVTVTIPNVLCDNCVLQMIQFMGEDPNVVRPYYSCSDIQIKAADDPTVVPPVAPAGLEITPNFKSKDDEESEEEEAAE